MFAAENGLKGDPRLQAISEAIRVIPNFPKPGIMFQDITPLLLNHKVFKDTVDIFVDIYKDVGISVVAGNRSEAYRIDLGLYLAKKSDIAWTTQRCYHFFPCYLGTTYGSLDNTKLAYNDNVNLRAEPG